MNEHFSINNAGLVILNSFFHMLFKRLNLVENREFISTEAQKNAVHYLQFIATGVISTEEELLVLNKILCGLNPTDSVPERVEINYEERELIEGLIRAAIEYWSAIGETSVNGFRGNWLVREGALRELDDHWEFVVEKRPYDILMRSSPFSFSIIQLPWMQKPLHVNWPF